MAEDIVTRLREGKGDDIVLFGMMYEAADEIEQLRKDRTVLAESLFDYTMSVAALRSQIHEFHHRPEQMSIEEWQKQLFSYSYNCQTPDDLFMFLERYRPRKITRDHADRRMGSE